MVACLSGRADFLFNKPKQKNNAAKINVLPVMVCLLRSNASVPVCFAVRPRGRQGSDGGGGKNRE